VDAKGYPEETIASQFSPLRPVETDDQEVTSAESDNAVNRPEMQGETSSAVDKDAEQSESSKLGQASEEFYGSGIAEPSGPEIKELPVEVRPTQPAITPIQSRPQAGATTNGAARESGSRSVTKSIPAAGKVVAASEIPGIRVITEGPSEILIRELTQYEVRVENRGSIDATGVIVRTELPDWAEVNGHNASVGEITPADAESDGQVEWIIESLPAGVVERLFIRIKAAKSGSFDVATNWTSLPQTHSARVTVREPKLSVEIEGPDEIIYGKSQMYRVRVMNPGDGLASNVIFTLAPDAEDSVEQPIGNIPAGKEASFEIELTARDQGELKIQGAASGDLDLTATADKSVAVASAKIDATLTGPPLKYQDTDAVYQLLVTNAGTAVSESIAAEIRIPAGVEYLGGIDSARVDGDRLIWNVKSLSPGESLNYEFTCKMAQTGNHQVTFNCNGTAAGSANVALETVVEAIADLKLAVFDPPAPAAVGAEVTYEIVIDNRGSKAAENVRCVAQFGHGIEPVRVDGSTAEVVTGQVLFAPIAQIEAGSQVKLRIVARADKPGDHRFRAEVRSGETVLVAEEATVYVPARNERISRSSNDPVNR
jgi:archaellum component FlaG (FlaF/FlaG flagellin family)